MNYDRAMQCLTQAIYYEAGSEPLAGQEAVAQVVLNRVLRPAFPKSVCGVVFEGAWRVTGCQFTFACDGSLFRSPQAGRWAQARAVAAQALSGFVDDAVGAATHYHASWLVPYWQPSMVETARIGGHIFYQPQNAAASIVKAAYSGIEPDPGSLPVRRFASARRASRSRPAPSPPAIQSATFSVWGLPIATVVRNGQDLMLRAEPGAPAPAPAAAIAPAS